MYLTHFSLRDFRNYKELDLTLEPGLLLFHGENAQGKTNLLEARSMLATANSFHASNDREVVNWYAPEHFARLDGTIKRQQDTLKIEIVIFDPTPPEIRNVVPLPHPVELPAHMPRKRLKVNDIPRRTMDVIGQMKVVLFAPTDLHLVDGSPEERRRFLDRALCQVQPAYCKALVTYRKIVTQRSALLKRIRENQEDPRMLDYLDERLTTLAGLIMFERSRMIEALNRYADAFQQSISGTREHLQIVYRPSFKLDSAWSIVDAPQHFRSQLRGIQRREIAQGVCLLGPHRDDLEFVVNDINMLTYGSRGQQRTAALSTKLAELAYMKDSTGDEPILLLDDVFSELDAARRGYLLQQVMQHQQVFLTATGVEEFPPEIANRAHIYQVVNGKVCRQ